MRPLAAILLLLVGVAAGWGFHDRFGRPTRGGAAEPVTIVAATLEAAQAQARMTGFAARFQASITSTQTRYGLEAKKTMIVPGTVRYELDWAKITPARMQWNAAQRVLLIDAPALEIAGPEIDLARIQEYSSGGLLMALTDAEEALDEANRAAARGALLEQARNPTLVAMARDATRASVAQTFALPLRAAGVEATVIVRFPGESAASM
jgi:hypothetical protein